MAQWHTCATMPILYIYVLTYGTMEQENYNQEFLEFINKKDFTPQQHFASDFVQNGDVQIRERRYVEGLNFTNLEFKFFDIEATTFLNCNFLNVDFFNVNFSRVEFAGCSFIKCNLNNIQNDLSDFENCIFSITNFTHCNFHSCNFLNVKIVDQCTLIIVEFKYCFITDFIIENSRLSTTEWQGIHPFKDIQFNNIAFNDAYYFAIDFSTVNYYGCSLTRNIFTRSKILADTFDTETEKLSINSNTIDLDTILNSNLNKNSLKIFGIHNDEIKSYIQEMVTEIKFQTVFISYSFEDRVFANALSHALMIKGVKTWFWERDAPGGRRLKHIMYENIQKHERLLFIASKHSLQSEACHYELAEGREKQTKEWKDIYFPIHIDDYLFKVRKEDIPRKYREDFWENIEEVKEFNSKDFSMFKTEDDFKSPEFEEAVKKLIKDLKL